MSKLLPYLVVRNPRNLEKLRFARKPTGYEFEKNRKFRSYYYRAELDLGRKHTTGSIRHHSEEIILSASTSEWPIAKRLYSNTDVSAAENIGRVLAHRCHQSGINNVMKGIDEDSSNQKLKAFYDAMESDGIILDELDFIEPNAEKDQRYHFVYNIKEYEYMPRKPQE